MERGCHHGVGLWVGHSCSPLWLEAALLQLLSVRNSLIFLCSLLLQILSQGCLSTPAPSHPSWAAVGDGAGPSCKHWGIRVRTQVLFLIRKMKPCVSHSEMYEGVRGAPVLQCSQAHVHSCIHWLALCARSAACHSPMAAVWGRVLC